MAIKIGKFYITRNNPRELLKTIADKQNIIDKAIKYVNKNITRLYIPENKKREELLNILKGDSDE